jgi:hypothetical protein
MAVMNTQLSVRRLQRMVRRQIDDVIAGGDAFRLQLRGCCSHIMHEASRQVPATAGVGGRLLYRQALGALKDRVAIYSGVLICSEKRQQSGNSANRPDAGKSSKSADSKPSGGIFHRSRFARPAQIQLPPPGSTILQIYRIPAGSLQVG